MDNGALKFQHLAKLWYFSGFSSCRGDTT